MVSNCSKPTRETFKDFFGRETSTKYCIRYDVQHDKMHQSIRACQDDALKLNLAPEMQGRISYLSKGQSDVVPWIGRQTG